MGVRLMARTWNRDTVNQLINVASPTEVAERLGMAVVRRSAALPKTLCPFHSDKTPSLVLFDEVTNRQAHYHCFACGAHGDIFSLVSEVKKCNFSEAVQWLADTFHIPQVTKRHALHQGSAATFDYLYDHPSAPYERALEIYQKRHKGKEIIEWVSARSLRKETASSADLAYAEAGTLTSEIQVLQDVGGDWRLNLALLEQAGLVQSIRSVGEPGDLFSDIERRYRDFFSDPRVIFPIKRLTGQIVGFAGRLVNNKAQPTAPKYLYSPRLPRGEVLYRGDIALKRLVDASVDRTISDLYICEGIVDALRLESMGVAAVSILGAQLSAQQLDVIKTIVEKVSPNSTVRCHIFLDRDQAGIRGAAKMATALAGAGIESSYVWPTTSELEQTGIDGVDQKDPDSIFKHVNSDRGIELLKDWRRPSALAVLTDRMGGGTTPDNIVDDEKWSTQTLSRRYRAATRIAREHRIFDFLLSLSSCDSRKAAEKWYSDITDYCLPTPERTQRQRVARGLIYIEDPTARLNSARALAKSGAERGELPSDEAAWRRIDLGATAFNIGLRERLRQTTFVPLEPFDSVYVARDFEKREPRLKAMPCPEDLILQQYMLAELLTERLDSADDSQQFSNHIPAVRYYRDSGTTETTAEDASYDRQPETLSFAYQIDMEVLEGHRNASNQGMFRPYIQCWHDFIDSLRRKAQVFGEVYAVRLDVKRYYDRLTRSTLRDCLKGPLGDAFAVIQQENRQYEFAPDFSESRQNLSDSVIDWLCDQSFNYEYYNPKTGRIDQAPPGVGIPQGPILSAWLGTVALFPLDAALRHELNAINGDSNSNMQAGYARYVDDIFLVAATPTALQRLREVAEDVARRLRLELIQKGEIIPRMSASDFVNLLAEGKAFVGSGPTQEMGLLHLGDGESGYETWQDAELRRASSLELLSDRRLYTADRQSIQDQLYTALQAPDLRPAEIPKVSRWIWYAVAEVGTLSSEDAWSQYWDVWLTLTREFPWSLAGDECPWNDPCIYALDGLEKMLSSANIHDIRLQPDAEAIRRSRLSSLAKVVLTVNFFNGFIQPVPNAPYGAGKGAKHLRRMFIQRGVSVRWIARQLTGDKSPKPFDEELHNVLGTLDVHLRSSLARAWLTDADGSEFSRPALADDGKSPSSPSQLRPLFLWLHEAIILLSREGHGDLEPLEPIAGSLGHVLSGQSHSPDHGGPDTGMSLRDSNFLKLLVLWLPDHHTNFQASTAIGTEALSTLLAVCHISNLLSCLSRRHALLGNKALGQVLPTLPGISSEYLILTKVEHVGDNHDQSTYSKLRCIQHLTVMNGGAPAANPPMPKLASKDGVTNLLLSWNPVHLPVAPTANRLLVQEAQWPASAQLLYVRPPAAPEKITFRHLKWASDAFEALALLNASSENLVTDDASAMAQASYEFVPAWPYLVFSSLPESDNTEDSSNLSVCLIGSAIPRELLGNFAFARDGKGQIKPYEVPLSDAWLWRIGFAVTDALGLATELDRYRQLAPVTSQPEFDAADHILNAMLRRLRGEHAPTAQLPRHPVAKHLPATIYRALRLLHEFPSSGDAVSEVSYALAVEAETRAMEIRLKVEIDITRRGEAVAFLERVATNVFIRLPAKWIRALPRTIVSIDDSQYRRSFVAWELLGQRLAELNANRSSEGAATSERGWRALHAGVKIAAIVAWVRSLVFELETEGRTPRVLNAVPPVAWGLDDCVLMTGDSSKNLAEMFTGATSGEENLASLSSITPIGWLVLLAQRLNLYIESDPKIFLPVEQLARLQESVTNLARMLGSENAPTGQDAAHWPFEALSDHEEGIASNANYDLAVRTLQDIDKAVGFSVTLVEADAWGIRPRSRYFLDHRGKPWNLSKVLVEQLPRDKHIEGRTLGRTFTRIWSETRNADGDLVGVSALGLNFATLVGLANVESHAEIFHGLSAPLERDRLAKSNAISPPPNVGDSTSIQEIAPPPKPDPRSLERTGDSSASAAAIPSPLSGRGTFDSWEKRQREEWSSIRKAKSPNHVRFALLQFRVDETYVHPLVDVGFPDPLEEYLTGKNVKALRAGRDEIIAIAAGTGDTFPDGNLDDDRLTGKTVSYTPAQLARAAASKRGTEYLWQQSDLLPSWNEHRRRQMLIKAVSACDSFGVEVLVLPEYSVRPDTIAWLKTHLEREDSKVSVIAGTYRLHGTYKDLHFSQSFNEIFGLVDHEAVFSGSSEYSAEKSAFITLLHPVDMLDGRKVVTALSRRKKYQSIAMGEVINPPGSTWEPLLEIVSLIQHLDDVFAKSGTPPVDSKQAVTLARRLYAAERVAELICSELFATTNPVNSKAILNEYITLRGRFGNSVDDSHDSLSKDIVAFANRISQLAVEMDRRTIIVVPAYTTRSADYWIYGQAALLAAGLTTVFCAAVMTEKSVKGGGSCFIGKSSWSNDKAIPGIISPTTPYSGWSRGIYYNKPSDALGKFEQAMVIADLDPIYMNEGKPRPQTLPSPISLVAHLPIIETVDSDRLRAAYKGTETPRQPEKCTGGLPSGTASNPLFLDIFENSALEKVVAAVARRMQLSHRNELMSPTDRSSTSTETTLELATGLNGFFADKSSWQARLDCWSKNWRELPFYGIPPSLLDWLHVDLTPTKSLPEILVPPWGSGGISDRLNIDAFDEGGD